MSRLVKAGAIIAAVVGLIAIFQFTTGVENIPSLFGMDKDHKSDGERPRSVRPTTPDVLPPSEEVFDYDSLFTKGSPFPRGFEMVHPGMPLSVARQAYPSPPAKLQPRAYVVPIGQGPFNVVLYHFRDVLGQQDPPIWFVEFRTFTQANKIKPAALRAFGTDGFNTSASGRAAWNHIGGYSVVIDQTAMLICSGPPESCP